MLVAGSLDLAVSLSPCIRSFYEVKARAGFRCWVLTHVRDKQQCYVVAKPAGWMATQSAEHGIGQSIARPWSGLVMQGRHMLLGRAEQAIHIRSGLIAFAEGSNSPLD